MWPRAPFDEPRVASIIQGMLFGFLFFLKVAKEQCIACPLKCAAIYLDSLGLGERDEVALVGVGHCSMNHKHTAFI